MLTPSDLVMVWNCRGLNSPARRDLVREFVSDSGAVFVALTETKLSSVNSFDVMAILGPRFDGFEYLPAAGTRGGILVAWQSGRLAGSICSLGDYSLTIRITPSVGEPWWFTTVYGPSTDCDKDAFLLELRDVAGRCPGSWEVAGDFNLILEASDKHQGVINRGLMGKFRRTTTRKLAIGEN